MFVDMANLTSSAPPGSGVVFFDWMFCKAAIVVHHQVFDYKALLDVVELPPYSVAFVTKNCQLFHNVVCLGLCSG